MLGAMHIEVNRSDEVLIVKVCVLVGRTDTEKIKE